MTAMHISDDDLVLQYYGEAGGAEATNESHLGTCDECRRRFRRLQRVMAAVDAAPAPALSLGFEADLWRRLEPQLPRRAAGWRTWLSRAPHRWALAGSMAALLLAAFIAGRFWPAASRPESPGAASAAARPEQVREAILLIALGDHLDRAQRVLVELANASATEIMNISSEQSRAGDLVAANRIYRETAQQAGETGVVEVLEDLERVLIEVANTPSALTARDLDAIRQRIEAQGILFKMRVISSQVREREKADIRRRNTSAS
ncbi:MAG: hypothetical protein LC804_27390 [Acidobacteria bacterium]|nr:hypothetical protein [Acidobacteriota bacterium]